MNFLGVGSLELLLIMIIGVTVVGPKRLILGIRSVKKILTQLKEQRDYLSEIILDEESIIDNELDYDNNSDINPVPIHKKETKGKLKKVDKLDEDLGDKNKGNKDG
tara:strand:+ start:169 stop:486 length:318 start_codon:yes stop_codon:yes gene_type:complete